MSNRINFEQTFKWYADKFEAATNRAESDTVMRAFLSTIHHIAGADHWDLETSPVAMREMTRVIDAWKRYKENPIEHQVKEIVKTAACKRWGLESWQWNTKIVVKRVEQNGPDSWIGYYNEPDTLADFKPTILPEPQDNGDIWLYDEDKWTRINDESTDEETRTAFTTVYEGITALDILHSLDPQDLTSIQGNEQAWDDAMKQAWKAHNSLSQLLTAWDEELSDLQAEAEDADPGEDEDNLDEDDGM